MPYNNLYTPVINWLIIASILFVSSNCDAATSALQVDSMLVEYAASMSDQSDPRRNALLDSTVSILINEDDSTIVKYGFKIASLYKENHNYEGASNIYQLIRRSTQSLGDSINESRSLYHLSKAYQNLGLPNRAYDASIAGLEIAEKQNDAIREQLLLTQIGNIKKEIGDIAESIVYYERALAMADNINDLAMSASLLNNIGSAHKMSGRYAEAKEYFFKAIDINKRIDNKRHLSYNYNNLANTFEETGDLENAIVYQQKSIDIKHEIKDLPSLSISYSNLAIIHIKLKQFEEAEEDVKQALKLAKLYKVGAIIPVIYGQYALILGEKKDYNRAFKYLDKIIAFKDSLTAEDRSLIETQIESNLIQASKLAEEKLKLSANETSLQEEDRFEIVLIGFFIFFTLLVVSFSLYLNVYSSREKLKNEYKVKTKLVNELTSQLDVLRSSIVTDENRLNEMQRDKDVFFSSVSHDMRGPLSAIVTIAGMMKSENDKKDEIAVLDYSVRALSALVDDILDFSHLEAGRLVIEHKEFSIRELLVDLVESFEFISSEKEIDLILEIESIPDSLVLVGDPRRISQVLFNLLQNAFKFTRDGYIKLACHNEVNDRGSCELHFLVEDTGIGMSPETCELIFEKYYQAPNDLYKDFGGSGLGLYISKALVGQMSGEIDVESELGDGSTFNFYLTLPIVLGS